jgi:hypothetical protein
MIQVINLQLCFSEDVIKQKFTRDGYINTLTQKHINTIKMTRRDVIKQTALLTGYALTASMMQGILNGCQANTAHADWKPNYFTQEQADLVSAIADRILPRTGTPGALDAGVPQYMEMMLKECISPREKEAFNLGLKSVNPMAIREFGKPFLELNKKDQESVLLRMESEDILAEIERREKTWTDPFASVEQNAQRARKRSQEQALLQRETVAQVTRRNQEMETLAPFPDLEAFERNRLNNTYPFFLRFKQMTLAGYFSSKVVGEEVTNYLPVPGEYQGCIPLSEVKNERIYSL